MIKYETIISNFDDKVTLYNWLRKVEEALKNASATNFVVNKKGNATLSFSITFADGTTLESGDIVLQQGESVDGARIASGVLQLHLTNGTWLTAGNLGAVSGFSINASQHLIVTYQDGTTQDLGAIFNGNVNIAGNFTADSIIENMTGYSFTDTGSDATITITPVYAGVVKNGNKLTFVYAFKATRLDTITSYAGSRRVGNFSYPYEVAQKLYPAFSATGFGDVYGAKKVTAIKIADITANVDLFAMLGAWSITSNALTLLNLNDLALNEEYYIRFEDTFLLSDNLAQ